MSVTLTRAKGDSPGGAGTSQHQRLPGEGADGLDGG